MKLYKYYKCKCGSDEFYRTYNVWTEKFKVKVGSESDEETWDVEELGKIKDHLVGYSCMKCNSNQQELNDGL